MWKLSIEIWSDKTNSRNRNSNYEVTTVWYESGNMVKFIPNSLFTTFVNLEFLYIHYNNKFETMKPEYLRNAKKLKNIYIRNNSVKKLNAQVFAEANNLEHINFYGNQIIWEWFVFAATWDFCFNFREFLVGVRELRVDAIVAAS